MALLPGYYTIQEAADVLEISHSQMAKYIREGRIDSIDLGGQRVVEQAKVHNFERKPRGNPNFGKQAAT